MATRNSRTQTRGGGKPAAKKASAATPTAPKQVLDEARAKADGIVADAEKVAAAAIAEATEEAEGTVQSLLDEAQQQADALRIAAEHTAATVRADAEQAAEQLKTDAAAQGDQLLEQARADAETEAADRLARAAEAAEQLGVEAAAAADRLRAEATVAATELVEQASADVEHLLAKARTDTEHLRGEAERVLSRGREDAERLRTDAEAEADRLRAAGAADRSRAQDEAAAVRAEAERLRTHAQETAEALRTNAEETAQRIRTAASAEAALLRTDAAADADRTRRTAEAEADRARTTARATVEDAENHAAQLTAQAKDEAAGIAARARTQAEELTRKAETAYQDAEATLDQARGEAVVLRADAGADRAQAAEALEQATSKTVQKLEKRKLKDDAAEELRAAKRNQKEARRQGRPTLSDKTRKALQFMAVRFLIIVPILAPMVVAWTGQSGFAMRVLGWSFAGSLVYAAAYEMTTAYCAWLYDQARRDGDKGWEYRLATWAFGIGAAVQQWWHYSHDWAATPKAVTFSAMSMVGVVLWELFARLIHRRKLRADRNLPPALPSLGAARWLRYPVRSWTARSLMIDDPDVWANTSRAWAYAGRIIADRKARRTGKAYASVYLVSVRRSGPDHGPSTIPAVQDFMDRTVLDRLGLMDRTATGGTARPAGGPGRSKEVDRGPADRTALPPGGPDRASMARTPADRTGGPDRPPKGAATSADRGPDRTARSAGPTPATRPDRTSTDRCLADGPPYTAPDGFALNEAEQRAIDVLRSTNRSITKRNIGDVIRTEGGSIASDRAAEIARHFPRSLRSA
ncbi:hypothetical protein ABR738_00455 [Streptomyces sp. Edi4]|uniref:hypothetical protein n=1 Tax=Streptomyces sp. Edi4 TaxID=3162527 RepID=UPI0033056864